jgi:predicted Zn-dependent protease
MTREIKRRSRWLLAMLLWSSVAAGCARNPVTGQQELSFVSESQEIAMGQQAAQDVASSIGLVQDEALQNYVQEVGLTLAKSSERPNLPWTFRVVDDPTPNAFALPGGFIFVTRGMMDVMDSEAELASVIGHEIGHVTAKHSVNQISRAQVAQLGLGLGMIFSKELRKYGDLANTGLQLLFLKYGRDDERQADDLGFRYAYSNGYDVREMVDVFETLQRLGASQESSIPAWLSTHPDPGERVQTAEARVAALSGGLDTLKVDHAQYLARIDGLVYGENPRNGYFDNGMFIHPDLRFKFQLPQGWQAQNTTQAVVAVSPNQDAAIQLTLAQGSSPAQAAQTFLSQQGIAPGQSSRETVNGIPAVASTFQAQTDQGVLQGLVAFFDFNGQVFQIMSYAPAERYTAYDNVFRQSLGSFSTLTDQRALSIQPNRIDIVQSPGNVTLAQLAAQHGSKVTGEELALINESPSVDAAVPRGQQVKVVVPGG